MFKKITLSLLLVALATTASAQTFEVPDDALKGGIGDIEDLLGTITDWLFTFLLILAVIFIILAAFSYLTSGGSEEKVKSAHQKVIFAIVAIAVAMLAKGVQFVVAELLGVEDSLF
jgi:hypothetical protein